MTPFVRAAALLGGVSPIVYTDFTQLGGALPSAIYSYTGASLRTMFDATGKLTYAPNNLIVNGTNLSASGWNVSSVSVTTGVSDPVGGTNANTLTATANSAYIYRNGSTTYSNGVVSVWMRRRTGSGTISLNTPNNASSVTKTLTSSWQQFSVSGAPNASGMIIFVINIGTSGDAIDVYMPVLTAVTYETSPRTNDQVVTTSAAFYGPAFDYNFSTLAPLGLRIEESRTNIALYNRTLATGWTASSVTLGTTAGLDGVSGSASTLTASAANGTYLQSVTLASSQRFMSAYVKRLTGTGEIDMTTDGGTTWTAITSQINTSGFTRVSVPAQTVTNPNFGFRIVTNGDAIAVDGVQNENGAVATSLIVNGSSAQVRAADVIMLAGGALSALKSAALSVVGEETSSEVSNYPQLISNGSSSIAQLKTSGQGQSYQQSVTLDTSNTVSNNVKYRVGASYGASGTCVCLSGGNPVSNSTKIGSVSSAYLGCASGTTNFLNGYLSKLAIYNTTLSAASLQRCTMLTTKLH